MTPNVVGGPGGIVGVMYLRYVGYIKVFIPAPQGLSHGSTKGVLAHLGHTATIQVPRTPRQGTPAGEARKDTQMAGYCSHCERCS